jgi:diacylglycerol kinase family enzyme
MAPGDIGLILVGDNPRATAHNHEKRRTRMQGDLNELLDSEYGDQVVAGISLDEAVAEARPKDIVVPRSGDGGVRWTVTELMERGKHKTAILPGRYGNASDFAVAHVGKHSPLGALRRGRLEDFWPIAVTLEGEGGTTALYGAGYFSAGATAKAVIDMDEARLGKLWQRIGNNEALAVLYEFGLSLRGLLRAQPFDIIDSSGQQRSIYNQMIARNPIIAKRGRIPQVDPLKPQVFLHEMTEKRLIPVAAAIGKLSMGRLNGTVTSEATSYTVVNGVQIQIDGDTWSVPPDTRVTVGPAEKSLQVVTTMPSRS